MRVCYYTCGCGCKDSFSATCTLRIISAFCVSPDASPSSFRTQCPMKWARTVALRTAGVSDVMAVYERWLTARGSRDIWSLMKLAREEL